MNRAEILSPPVRDVFILDQTNPTQALLECFNERLVISVGGGTNREKSKSDRTFALLRACRERPRRRAAKQRDERAPLHHSITSSARASTEAGRSRPSALAVVKLMTKSNLVGCSTGISAGFAPRRTLSINSAARRNAAGKFAP